MLLVDYDDEHYIFNDPLRNKNTYYRKSAVEAAYAGLFKQAIVIINKAQGIDPEVTKYICEQKVKEVLSAFSASDIN